MLINCLLVCFLKEMEKSMYLNVFRVVSNFSRILSCVFRIHGGLSCLKINVTQIILVGEIFA